MSNFGRRRIVAAIVCSTIVFVVLGEAGFLLGQQPAADVAELNGYRISQSRVGPRDWPQWGGTSLRNNAPHGKNIPSDWAVPYDDIGQKPRNIKWWVDLGSQTYG